MTRAPVLLVAVLAACSARTEVVVVVRGDAPFPASLRLDVADVSVDGGPAARHTIDDCADGACLPVVLTLKPGPAHPDDSVTVELQTWDAPDATGDRVQDDFARFQFRDGESDELDFFVSTGKCPQDCAAKGARCAPFIGSGTCTTDGPTPLAGDPSLDLGRPAARDLAVADDLAVAPDDLAVAPDLAPPGVKIVATGVGSAPKSPVDAAFLGSTMAQAGDVTFAVAYVRAVGGAVPSMPAPPGWSLLCSTSSTSYGVTAFFRIDDGIADDATFTPSQSSYVTLGFATVRGVDESATLSECGAAWMPTVPGTTCVAKSMQVVPTTTMSIGFLILDAIAADSLRWATFPDDTVGAALGETMLVGPRPLAPGVGQTGDFSADVTPTTSAGAGILWLGLSPP